jgi:hypothetical protein
MLITRRIPEERNDVLMGTLVYVFVEDELDAFFSGLHVERMNGKANPDQNCLRR